VYERDGLVCRGCGRRVERPFGESHERFWAHVHEVVLRSRGGDPSDPDICVLLCANCHMPNGNHGDRPAMELLADTTAGPVLFTFRDGRVRVSASIGWLATAWEGADPTIATPF
jgi:hypothetical protein